MSDVRYEPPSWDELFELTGRTLAATAGEPELANDASETNLATALAALARSRRLMMGLQALVEADLADVIGITLRTLFECWLVGVYALLGGAGALEALLGQRDFHMKKLAEVLGESSEEFQDGRNLPVAELAKRVTALLEERGNPNAAFATACYNSLYRFESYNSTHGGIGSIIGHLDETELRRRIREVRPVDDAGTRHRYLMGLSMLVSIGQMAALDGGFPHDALDNVGAVILGLNPRMAAADSAF